MTLKGLPASKVNIATRKQSFKSSTPNKGTCILLMTSLSLEDLATTAPSQNWPEELQQLLAQFDILF